MCIRVPHIQYGSFLIPQACKSATTNLHSLRKVKEVEEMGTVEETGAVEGAEETGDKAGAVEGAEETGEAGARMVLPISTTGEAAELHTTEVVGKNFLEDLEEEGVEEAETRLLRVGLADWSRNLRGGAGVCTLSQY